MCATSGEGLSRVETSSPRATRVPYRTSDAVALRLADPFLAEAPFSRDSDADLGDGDETDADRDEESESEEGRQSSAGYASCEDNEAKNACSPMRMPFGGRPSSSENPSRPEPVPHRGARPWKRIPMLFPTSSDDEEPNTLPPRAERSSA